MRISDTEYYSTFSFLLQASKKKVYMLYGLQPDRSVTGGPWYSDHDLESEFVEVLNQQCFKFLEQKVRFRLLSDSPHVFHFLKMFLNCSTQ